MERVPGLLEPHARRTRRLAAAQSAVGVTVGAEAGARLLTRLAMPASADTLLRLVRRLPLPRRATPHALGIDDWALEKGRTYGTILIDLDAHHVVDALPDRTARTLAAWLRRRRGVQVIARDRSTEYARGASAGAPQAAQIADRWHLVLNARQMLERWLATAHARGGGRQGREPGPARGALPRGAPRGRGRRAPARDEPPPGPRARDRAEVRCRGLLPRARGTSPGAQPPRSVSRESRSAAGHGLCMGCENAAALWREIRALGYRGTPRQVSRWLRDRRTTPAPTTPRKWRGAPRPPQGPDGAPPLPSPKQLAWLLVQPPASLTAPEAAVVARLAQDTEAARVVRLVRRFVEIVRAHAAPAAATLTRFDVWLTESLASGVDALTTFAAGLAQDGAAPCARRSPRRGATGRRKVRSPNSSCSSARCTVVPTSRHFLDAPHKDPSRDALSEVEIVDPAHPLFGRRFPLASTSSTLTGPGYAWVVYRGDMRLRLPLAATNLAAARVGVPLVPTKLTPEAITELLALAGQVSSSEVPCPSAHPTSGAACPPRSRPRSPPTSPRSSRR